MTRVIKAGRTPIEDELQFNELHIYKFGVDLLVGDPHANMLHLDQIALQRVVKPVLKDDEVRDLDRDLSSMFITSQVAFVLTWEYFSLTKARTINSAVWKWNCSSSVIRQLS